MLEELKKLITDRLNKLPGEEAHEEMAPGHRKERKSAMLADPSPRRSAVMILIYDSMAPKLALIQRADYPGVHGGQIGLPGGKVEPEDKDLLSTALRETKEEIGIDTIEVCGQLTELYIPPSRFMVTPYVGFLDKTPLFIPEISEVQQVVEVPIEDFLNPKNILSKSFNSGKIRFDAPYFKLEEHVVWGATAMMLNELRWIFLSR